ncbi:aspartyl protease family protein [Vulcanisaeta sp. JCM 16159]|uniref:aspartyl protease family protein n=1 Tax=Vulcanisaeta sp. JCM 16159 TaxID=1295371 RepID=UPI000B21A9E3|nr:aspartyl protease family protein [Vulcanisaeta sp. JCM 16159]
MDHVYVDVTIKGQASSRTLKMLVDTGSTYIVLDPDTAKELGLIETPYTVELTMANGTRERARVYIGEAEAKGRRGPVIIAALRTPTPLLSMYALESLGFKVNPRTGELEKIGPEGATWFNSLNAPA